MWMGRRCARGWGAGGRRGGRPPRSHGHGIRVEVAAGGNVCGVLARWRGANPPGGDGMGAETVPRWRAQCRLMAPHTLATLPQVVVSGGWNLDW